MLFHAVKMNMMVYVFSIEYIDKSIDMEYIYIYIRIEYIPETQTSPLLDKSSSFYGSNPLKQGSLGFHIYIQQCSYIYSSKEGTFDVPPGQKWTQGGVAAMVVSITAVTVGFMVDISIQLLCFVSQLMGGRGYYLVFVQTWYMLSIHGFSLFRDPIPKNHSMVTWEWTLLRPSGPESFWHTCDLHPESSQILPGIWWNLMVTSCAIWKLHKVTCIFSNDGYPHIAHG